MSLNATSSDCDLLQKASVRIAYSENGDLFKDHFDISLEK
jgi:hypothetical protein